MNQIELGLKQTIQQAVRVAFQIEAALEDITIEIPKEKTHGDYATNLAMRLSKELKQNPRQIASTLLEHFDLMTGMIESCEIAGPGFINFFMKQEQLAKIISNVIDQQENYGASNHGKGVKYNIEYVSANPTGDLHPGHARGAAIGDSICRIMKFAGYDVTREYYINDAGNPVIRFLIWQKVYRRVTFNNSIRILQYLKMVITVKI